mmetsp:Transcript_24087/g.59536  ORF Transcript_24087/g.59536 Transcript_24087/m.59536 type:complete len:234 (-) Transcript_24087:972-1673(-)
MRCRISLSTRPLLTLLTPLCNARTSLYPKPLRHSLSSSLSRRGCGAARWAPMRRASSSAMRRCGPQRRTDPLHCSGWISCGWGWSEVARHARRLSRSPSCWNGMDRVAGAQRMTPHGAITTPSSSVIRPRPGSWRPPANGGLPSVSRLASRETSPTTCPSAPTSTCTQTVSTSTQRRTRGGTARSHSTSRPCLAVVLGASVLMGVTSCVAEVLASSRCWLSTTPSISPRRPAS